MKKIVIFLLFLSALTAFAQENARPAEFPGGMDALHQYINENMQYPVQARENGEEGVVMVKFSIDSTGKVCNAIVAHSVSPALDAEALRVINQMPQWKPRVADGVETSADFSIPFNFVCMGKTVQKAKKTKQKSEKVRN